MRWINHKITTFSLVYLFTKNPVVSILAMFGSIIPDSLEGRSFESIQWKRNHRKITHWAIAYLIISLIFVFLSYMRYKTFIFSINPLLALYMLKQAPTELVYFSIIYIGFFFSLGALLHIAEDSISGKVPLLNPWKRVFGTKLIVTGSVWEYLISFSLFSLAVLFFFYN